MPNRRTRRQRLLTKTANLGAGFVVAAGVASWFLLRPGPVRQPGEQVEGLTSRLTRDLPEDYPRIRFVDVTQQVGISFQHFHGRRSSQLPEDMGSGAAWGDYDNDGWPDLFVVNISGPLSMSKEERASSPATSALYHNDGDGTFTDVSAEAGVAHRSIGMGAEWGDYDGDGWIDLFLSCYGENTLYHNNGNGTFRDVSNAAGIAGYSGFWAGVAMADYDRDGDLDIYVTGYVRYEALPWGARGTRYYDVDEPAALNPSSFHPERNLLYRNNGDGTFTEAAGDAGVLGEEGRSLEATWTDFDEDGWLDLYVANDVSDNVLYRNLGNGKFVDISHAARVADYRGAMGIAVGDWDGDADVDMFVTHWIAQENALYDNQLARLHGTSGNAQTLQFMDTADRFGLGQVALDFIGWGTSFVDYDNDGRLDLFVVNGSTFQRPDAPHQLVPMRDQLFWNRGTKHGFYDVSLVSGEYFGSEAVGRGAAFADYDRDGDVDVFIVNNGGRGTLLRNDGGNGRSWLGVRLNGSRSGRLGVGAHIRIVVGRTTQVRQVGAQSSYLSQNDVVEHFGLGEAQLVDTLEVIWPLGGRDVLTALARNQIVSVAENAHR